MKLTLLAEDGGGGAGPEVPTGFSCWVEAGSANVLFDTGLGDRALRKAGELGLDVTRLDAVVLSHGHSSHSGGLDVWLDAHPLRVIAHPDFDAPRRTRSDGADTDIGVPGPVRARLATARLERRREPLEVMPGVWTSGEIPRVTDEGTGEAFLLDGTEPDPLRDDQALIIAHRAGLVVVLGCAHAGVLNTLGHVDTLFPGRPLLALVGGMHLHRASDERVAQIGAEVFARAPRLVAPCHCSGDRAQRWFESALGARYRHGVAGSVLAWDAGASIHAPALDDADYPS